MTFPHNLKLSIHHRAEPRKQRSLTTLSMAGFSLRLEALMTQYGHWLVGLMILFFVAIQAPNVYGRHVWYDELTTYYIARTFSWSSICEALRLTADAQPPTYHFLQIPVLFLLGDDPRNLRWLTLLASAVSLAATFVWLRRTASAVAAVAGAAMLAGSELGYYSTEARPYALLVAAVSLALAARGLTWRILWLAIAVSLHYYAFFVPIALAFTERSWRRRAAYALALCPLLITLPAMQPVHLLTLGGPFSASLYSLWTTMPSLAGGSLLAIEALVLVAVACCAPKKWREWLPRDGALWALVAMIPFCWLMGRGFTGTFFPRYAIVSLLGVAGIIAWFVDRLPHRALVSAAFTVLALGSSLMLAPEQRWDGRPTANLIGQAITMTHRPVVMGHFTFLDVYYQLTPANRDQFYRLTPNRPTFTTSYSYRPGPHDSYSEMIGKYAGFTPVGAQDWFKGHSSFTVVALDEADWILVACRKQGATITPVSHGETPGLYAVAMPAFTTLSSR